MIDRGEPRKLNVNIKISSSNSIKVLILFYYFRNNIKMYNCYLMIVLMHKKQKSILTIQEDQILRNLHKLLKTDLLRAYKCVMNTLNRSSNRSNHNDLFINIIINIQI